jgi:hypothetical protein
MRVSKLAAVVLCLVVAFPALALAEASGVGLGVAFGGAYSGTQVDRNSVKESVGARPAWGFFVDIPLLPTFYISPAAMLYTFKNINGDGKDVAVTDVDLNFKFIVPVGSLHFGAGLTGGLTSGVQTGYATHFGVLGFASLNLVANLDGFVLVQYKRLNRDVTPVIDDIHGYVGAMFRF